MADIGQDIAGTGVNMVAGRAIDQLAGRNSFVPIPSFYNPDSPNHFGDSQMVQMARGNPNAWRGYGRRAAANAVDTGLMFANPAVGLVNKGVGFVAGLFGHPNWTLGGLMTSGMGNQQQPTGTVGGEPATTTPTSSTSGDMSIDPWTGQQISGGGAPWMSDSNSSYGPYASGYQAPSGQQPDNGTPSWIPDFSHYSDPLFDGPQDENGNGVITPGERRDAGTNWQQNGPNAIGSGVSNFMANGSNVINGVRPAGGDMNGIAVYNPRLNGG